MVSEPLFTKPPPGYVAGRGRGAGGLDKTKPVPQRGEGEDNDGEDDGEDMSTANSSVGPYATALGDDDVGLFAGLGYDKEDDEADMVWDSIDERMDSRRKEKREELQRKNLKKLRKERPKIQRLFSKEKELLKSVTEEEWNSIPDIGDRSKSKKKKWDRLTPAPDSLVLDTRTQRQVLNNLDLRLQIGGLETPNSTLNQNQTPINIQTPISTGVQDLKTLGLAKKSLIQAKLEKASDSVTGLTSVNPWVFLTNLNSKKVSSSAEVGDKKKVTNILKAVTKVDEKNPKAWIFRAKLEEESGKLVNARKIISQGFMKCPQSEDIWLEAARLHPPDEAKNILAHAANAIPNSIAIWTTAAKFETDQKLKKRILRKGLEHNPQSFTLWKAAIKQESSKGAKILLQRAVECIPEHAEIWIALAKLETYENAKKILNQAIQTLPTEKSLWIAGAQLEEANKNEEGVRNVIKKCIFSFTSQGVANDREEWLKEALQCEKLGSVAVCQAIVMETIGIGVEDEDKIKIWTEDAEKCVQESCLQCARAIYARATTEYPGDERLWVQMVNLERKHGGQENIMKTLSESVKHCKKSETLWLRYAKETWEMGDIDGARKILSQAFEENPDNEEIWLTAVKLEQDNELYQRARTLLEKARSSAGTARVWMKSALLERELGNDSEELNLLQNALKRYPDYPKLWLMLAQFHERHDAKEARKIYVAALEACPTSVPIWIGFSKLEERVNGLRGARMMLEKARLKIPNNPDLWLESIRNEVRYANGDTKLAMNMLSKAIKECPTSGKLWAEIIELEEQNNKKTRCFEALKKCDTDGNVLISVSKLFVQQEQIEKARMWVKRAITEDSKLGDAWAYAFKFETIHGNEESRNEIIKKCKLAEPKYGEKWISVSKKTGNSKLKIEDILKEVVRIYYP
jgi:pre-mRNA-processing factor 6